MTILENLSLGLQYHADISREEAHEQVTEVLEQFELYENRFMRPAQLTLEQRRLAVYARELVKRPQLFLLEHPTLDLGERVYSLLAEILHLCRGEQGCAFLVASVQPELVSRWADWVLIFDENRCAKIEADSFDPSVYLKSMRRLNARTSGKGRTE
jgi:ABC-type lipoprotein export system ATPase subunit